MKGTDTELIRPRLLFDPVLRKLRLEIKASAIMQTCVPGLFIASRAVDLWP